MESKFVRIDYRPGKDDPDALLQKEIDKLVQQGWHIGEARNYLTDENGRPCSYWEVSVWRERE